mgnify:CR=1 FL=1|jgi:hypothetical protein
MAIAIHGKTEKNLGYLHWQLRSSDSKATYSAKAQFTVAQKNKSVVWQSVFSFRNDFLAENNIYNPETRQLDEVKLLDASRVAHQQNGHGTLSRLVCCNSPVNGSAWLLRA